jgi:Ankyrin repeats (many copies)/KTSC domain
MQVLSYDPVEGELRILSPAGNQHDFFDVPSSLYQQMRRSGSETEFFNAKIWNKFEYRTHWRSLDDLFAYLVEHFHFDEPVSVASHRGDHDTPLHIACIWGDLGAVELLLANGAEPDAAGDEGCTPLYNAVSFGFVRCAKRLVAAGASPDATNELDTTPREEAQESANPRMSELFSDPD